MFPSCLTTITRIFLLIMIDLNTIELNNVLKLSVADDKCGTQDVYIVINVYLNNVQCTCQCRYYNLTMYLDDTSSFHIWLKFLAFKRIETINVLCHPEFRKPFIHISKRSSV